MSIQEQDIARLVSAIVDTLQGHAGRAEDAPCGTPAVKSDGQQANEQATQEVRLKAKQEIGQEVRQPEEQTALAPLTDITTAAFKAACRVRAPHKPDVLAELRKATGARIAAGTCGTRPPTAAYLRFLADHARSKGTVFKEVSQEWLDRNGLWSIRSMVEDKNTYLTRPDLGRLLSPETVNKLRERYPAPSQVQIVLSDGLSTDALLSNYEEILPPLCKGLKNAGFTTGEPFFLHYGRVKAEDVIGEAIGCDVVLLLIGERPGLGQSESMSCYAVYRPTARTIESQRTVISNIHRGGIPPVEAAAVIVELTGNILRHKASGIELNRKMGGGDA